MVTDKQKSLVSFCEEWLNIEFEGNLNDKEEVEEFLNSYLSDAESIYNEVRCEYEGYTWDCY